MIFERGRFTVQDTEVVARLLKIFVFAVPAWVMLQVAGRGFYAREDMWRPMLLGTAVAALAVPLYWTLGKNFGAPGVAAAAPLAMSANAILLLVLLRWVHGGPALVPLAATFGRTLLIGVLAAIAASFVPVPGKGAFARFLTSGTCFVIFAVPLTWLLGDQAMRELLSGLLRRIRRRGR